MRSLLLAFLFVLLSCHTSNAFHLSARIIRRQTSLLSRVSSQDRKDATRSRKDTPMTLLGGPFIDRNERRSRRNRQPRDISVVDRERSLQLMGSLLFIGILGVASTADANADVTAAAGSDSKPDPVRSQRLAGRNTAIDTAILLKKASTKALGGGTSGALASLAQLVTLGWLRTTMNYQYVSGLSLTEALQTLYQDGGIPRFYKGLSVAAIQLPLARFGDVFATGFALAAFDSYEGTQAWPLFVKTGFASVMAGLWRFALSPVDSLKTTLQVQGSNGLPHLAARLKEEGVSSLYQGSIAQSVATAEVGHFPYFLTFNYLLANLPVAPENEPLLRLGRNAFMGFCASTASDCCSNSIRVLKTTKQTSEKEISYQEALTQVLEKDGWIGLFIRGLSTRLVANGLQGALFAVVWRWLEETYFTIK